MALPLVCRSFVTCCQPMGTAHHVSTEVCVLIDLRNASFVGTLKQRGCDRSLRW